MSTPGEGRAREFPGRMASYKALDAWLRACGWVSEDDRGTAWRLMVGRTVRIRTLSAAIDTQLRRDRARRRT